MLDVHLYRQGEAKAAPRTPPQPHTRPVRKPWVGGRQFMRPSARLLPGLPPRLAGSKRLGGSAAEARCLWPGTDPLPPPHLRGWPWGCSPREATGTPWRHGTPGLCSCFFEAAAGRKEGGVAGAVAPQAPFPLTVSSSPPSPGATGRWCACPPPRWP